MNIRIRAALLALLVASVIPVTSASAITSAEISQQDINKAIQEQQATVRQRLDAAMLDICKQYVGSMNMMKTFMGNMGDLQIKFIRTWHESAIAYKEKNKIDFPTYQSLASTAEQKYDAALTALAEYLAVPNFTCDSSGPKADYMLLMIKYMQLIQAIFNYIIAVINLYMGIIMAQIQAFMAQIQSSMQANITQVQNDAQFNLGQITGGKQ